MRYRLLIEFCEFIVATKAGDDDMGDFHVHKNGYIEKAWVRVLDAIHRDEDFDVREYMRSLIRSSLDSPPNKLLN